MKYVSIIAGILLGLLFVASSAPFFVPSLLEKMMASAPPMPEDAKAFMAVFMATGYMKFVKVCELLGGILVAIPRTRNLGLLILGPIIINILAFHAFVKKGEGLFAPMMIVIVVLTLGLLWCERKAFAGLVNRPQAS